MTRRGGRAPGWSSWSTRGVIERVGARSGRRRPDPLPDAAPACRDGRRTAMARRCSPRLGHRRPQPRVGRGATSSRLDILRRPDVMATSGRLGQRARLWARTRRAASAHSSALAVIIVRRPFAHRLCPGRRRRRGGVDPRAAPRPVGTADIPDLPLRPRVRTRTSSRPRFAGSAGANCNPSFVDLTGSRPAKRRSWCCGSRTAAPASVRSGDGRSTMRHDPYSDCTMPVSDAPRSLDLVVTAVASQLMAANAATAVEVSQRVLAELVAVSRRRRQLSALQRPRDPRVPI